jgi:hypothetical protein
MQSVGIYRRWHKEYEVNSSSACAWNPLGKELRKLIGGEKTYGYNANGKRIRRKDALAFKLSAYDGAQRQLPRSPGC